MSCSFACKEHIRVCGARSRCLSVSWVPMCANCCIAIAGNWIPRWGAGVPLRHRPVCVYTAVALAPEWEKVFGPSLRMQRSMEMITCESTRHGMQPQPNESLSNPWKVRDVFTLRRNPGRWRTTDDGGDLEILASSRLSLSKKERFVPFLSQKKREQQRTFSKERQKWFPWEHQAQLLKQYSVKWHYWKVWILSHLFLSW